MLFEGDLITLLWRIGPNLQSSIYNFQFSDGYNVRGNLQFSSKRNLQWWS